MRITTATAGGGQGFNQMAYVNTARQSRCARKVACCEKEVQSAWLGTWCWEARHSVNPRYPPSTFPSHPPFSTVFGRGGGGWLWGQARLDPLCAGLGKGAVRQSTHLGSLSCVSASTASSLHPDPNTGQLASPFVGHLPMWKTNLRKCQRIGIGTEWGVGWGKRKWLSWLKSQGSLERQEETTPHLQIRNKWGDFKGIWTAGERSKRGASAEDCLSRTRGGGGGLPQALWAKTQLQVTPREAYRKDQ